MQILAGLAFLLTAATHTPSTVPVPVPKLKAQSACTVVTKAEIEAALGRPVSNGVEHKDTGQTTCDYTGGEGQITIALGHSALHLGESDVVVVSTAVNRSNPEVVAAQTRPNSSAKLFLSPLAIFSIFTSDTFLTPRSTPL